MLGEILDGKYEILTLLGRGGMGAVYQALHVGTRRRVAVKVIDKRVLGSGGEAESRFRREARAAGAIESEHIIQVLDASTDDSGGPLYIVMEYLPGEDLGHVIERLGPLPPEVALRIGVQALEGLRKAHEAGIVHRDIKPANLFLARREKGRLVAKVLDFGIAKIMATVDDVPHTTDLTRTDTMLGSPRFMSPEQARNSRSIDHRTDLWSLGASLYCALTGHAPYHRVQSLGQLILTLCTVPPPTLDSIAPWVPGEVAHAVHGALAIDPDDRYPSAQAMLDALQALLPGGDALREEMLAALPPEVRALAVEPPPPVSMRAWGAAAGPQDVTVLVHTQGDASSGAADRLGFASPGAAGVSPDTGTVEVEDERSAGERPASAALLRRPRPGTLVVAGATLLAAVLGLGAYRGTSSSPPVRRARLVVMPADASVEVDGKSAPVRGGVVEIAGALGSGHRVRVFKGTDETDAEVFVTEEGAQPPKLELPTKTAPALSATAITGPQEAVPSASSPPRRERPVAPAASSHPGAASVALRPTAAASAAAAVESAAPSGTAAPSGSAETDGLTPVMKWKMR